MVKMKSDDLSDTEWRKQEINQWYTLLDALWPAAEAPITHNQVSALFRRIMWAERETVRMLRIPFRKVFERLHASQQWGLFAVVTEAPDSLIIEVRRDKKWEMLYQRLDSEHNWHDAQLKYRRIRGVWDGVKEEPKGTYKRLTTWIAQMIFDEMPDVDRVRVVLEKHHEAVPWKEPKPEIKRRAERYHRREEIEK